MKEVLNVEDRNAQIAAMQAKFQETIAKLREELTTKLRVEEEANTIMREKEAAETKKREADRRGTAVSTMGPMWTRGVSTGGGLCRGLPYVPRGTVPKIPVECPPYVYIAWERRFEVFIANQGLHHTNSPDAPEIAVISCKNDAYLFGHFGESLVTDHRRVWGYISKATAGAPFEDRLYECHSVSDALRTMRESSLPLQPAERHLLVAELERVQFMGDEDPNFFFARIFRLETTMRAVGIEKTESEIVQIILRQLPERYDLVKTITLADPQLTRPKLEIPSVPSTLNARPMKLRNNGRRWVYRRNHRTTMLYLTAVACLGSSSSSNTGLAVMACRGSRSNSNTGLATVACRGSSSSNNTGLAVVACHGSSSNINTGLATVACRRSSSSNNTGLAVVACRGSSSNSINGLAAAPMFYLRPGRRDSSNRYSNRHGESLRSEVTGRTKMATLQNVFSAVMAGLLKSGFSREMWRCRCSPCRRDRSSRRRRQWHLLQQHLRLKR